jgi:hypothetical protein
MKELKNYCWAPMFPNKSLKVVATPLDVPKRRMLRILRAVCGRPLALRYTA